MIDNTLELEQLEIDEFLIRNRITKEDFDKANIGWDNLLQIGVAHRDNYSSLAETAAFLSSVLQQGKGVHSVRWRIKDPEHLMGKIIRKRISKTDKYLNISLDNFMTVVTDLIGIRVLHLFKKEWLDIHGYIKENWEMKENPVAFVRNGDDTENELFKNNNCEIKSHSAGYRSIHYIISTRPMKQEIFSEIQVRTIFEEGWSEIDHRVRYPNYSDNQLISYFLKIFNRLSGSADEMGSFVLDLKDSIEQYTIILQSQEAEKKESIDKIDELISKLEQERGVNSAQSSELQELKKEINILKKNDETFLTIHENPYTHTQSPFYMLKNYYEMQKIANNKNINSLININDLSDITHISKALQLIQQGIKSSTGIDFSTKTTIFSKAEEKSDEQSDLDRTIKNDSVTQGTTITKSDNTPTKKAIPLSRTKIKNKNNQNQK